jgi:hypothetical protein
VVISFLENLFFHFILCLKVDAATAVADLLSVEAAAEAVVSWETEADAEAANQLLISESIKRPFLTEWFFYASNSNDILPICTVFSSTAPEGFLKRPSFPG